MRLISILAAVTISGLFATVAPAQNSDPGSAPPSLKPAKQVPVNPAELKRENANPGSAPASLKAAKPAPVDSAEVKRENAIPGGAPAAAKKTSTKKSKKQSM